MLYYAGRKVIESRHFVIPDGEMEIKIYRRKNRGITVRKWVTKYVPDPNYYLTNDSIMAHPETMAKLYAALETEEESKSRQMWGLINGWGFGIATPPIFNINGV